MNRFIIIFIMFVSCQSVPLENIESIDQPSIISISPHSGALLMNVSKVKIEFSDLILETSVSFDSLQVIREENENEVIISGESYLNSENILIWDLKDQKTMDIGTYHIVLSSDVRSKNNYPIKNLNHSNRIGFFTIIRHGDEIKIEGVGEDDFVENQSEIKIEELFINEFFYDVDGDETDGYQFIELYGTPKAKLDHYVIQFINGSNGEVTGEITIPEFSFIGDDGLFVIADSKKINKQETNVKNFDLIYNFDPQNGPDSVLLFNSRYEIQDTLGYGDLVIEKDIENHFMYESIPAEDAPKGMSLSRKDKIDTDHNKKDFFINLNPSPGEFSISLVEGVEDEGDHKSLNKINFNSVYISEVVVDPQQDWDDSQNGNGILFDEDVGDGTVGYNDEWIEIKNGSQKNINLFFWKIKMEDGTDEEDIFGESDSVFLFSDGGNLENFKPQEFLIIGNPKGSMKNSIDISIYNESNELISFVNIPDGNSDSFENESVIFDENLNLIKSFSTPFF